jgi:hypothetical protein
MKKSIEIDIEVHRAIEIRREDFDESQNDILRRILGLNRQDRISGNAEFLFPDSAASEPVPFFNRASRLAPVPPPMSHAEGEEDQPQIPLSHRIKEFHSRISNQYFTSKLPSVRDWQFGGVRLPEGTRLQKWYGGQKYEAEIRDGAIWFDGIPYQSPSAAAMVITGGSNVSGWSFWKYFDPKDGEWKKLGSLRAGSREEDQDLTGN